MAAFTAFGPMWGIVTAAADTPVVRAVSFAEPIGDTIPHAKRPMTTAVHWQRDANGRLVCHWDRTATETDATK